MSTAKEISVSFFLLTLKEDKKCQTVAYCRGKEGCEDGLVGANMCEFSGDRRSKSIKPRADSQIANWNAFSYYCCRF